MSRLDIATVLLQWATGGLFFLWVTTRHRLVGLGYGWLLRGVFAIMGAGAIAANGVLPSTGRTLGAVGLVVASVGALISSMVRRGAGVSGGRAELARKLARVAAMTGEVAPGVASATATLQSSDRTDPATSSKTLPSNDGAEPATASILMRDQFGRAASAPERVDGVGPEFAPWLDLIAPAFGVIGLVFAAVAATDSHGNSVLQIARVLVGAAFLGAFSDAMLLGHWYLTQPGLTRRPIVELNDWLLRLWPIEVGLLLVPTGMVSVITGSVDDKWGGMLGWMWIACALTTGALASVTRIVLKERYYSAVMAATGMLYLAILTAFGTDIVARAVLSG